MAGARRSARRAATRKLAKCTTTRLPTDSSSQRRPGEFRAGVFFSARQRRGNAPIQKPLTGGRRPPVRTKTNRSWRGSPMAEHPAPGFTPPLQTSAKNRSKQRKNPRTDVLAYHPSGDFPTMMRIARTTEPFSHRTCTVRKRPFNQPLFPSPAPARGRITSSCRRWSSWQPSERRSWRLRPSERRSSGPSSRPRQRWHPRRRRSSSQRSCANGASWASPP